MIQLIESIQSSLSYIFDETYTNSLVYSEMDENSPILSSMGNNPNVTQSVEELFKETVGVWTYTGESVTNEVFITYDKLSIEILEQINNDLSIYILTF